MDTQKLSGIFLIVAFVAVLASTVVNAPGLYQTEDIEQRLAIIDSHRTRWLFNQGLVGVSALFTIAGFAALASSLRGSETGWLPLLAAAAIVAGTISGAYFLYLQTTDPRGGYSGAYPTPENLAYWLWLAGTLLFGVTLLRAGLPAWIGYLSAGAAVAYAFVFLVTGAGFMTPFILGLLQLLIGIVLLRT